MDPGRTSPTTPKRPLTCSSNHWKSAYMSYDRYSNCFHCTNISLLKTFVPFKGRLIHYGQNCPIWQTEWNQTMVNVILSLFTVHHLLLSKYLYSPHNDRQQFKIQVKTTLSIKCREFYLCIKESLKMAVYFWKYFTVCSYSLIHFIINNGLVLNTHASPDQRVQIF